jgi:DNA topoisomerase III
VTVWQLAATRGLLETRTADSQNTRGMRTFLNVAEKPSAAREISSAIARSFGAQASTRNTVAPYNKVIEFQAQLSNVPTQVVFTSVTGHLKSSDFEDRYRKWGSCDPAALLDPSLSQVTWFVPEEKRSVEQNLRQEARRAHTLILWLDCDSEGEKIAQDVADICKSANRTLVVKRARFSAMTGPELMHALHNLVDLDVRTVAMVATRQEIDLRAGAAYTRYLTQVAGKFETNTDPDDSGVISYGPCQFPTLGLVVDRWLTIEHFTRRQFWVIDLKLRACGVGFQWARCRLFEEYSAHTLYELCVEESAACGNQARVERVSKRSRQRWRPLPLSTVELQKAASRVLRISSDRTMEAAEKLYTAGLISYPRTETDRFASSYDLQSLISSHVSNPGWGSFASRLLTPPVAEDAMTFQWPRSGPHDDHAHPPIHPTSPEPQSFSDDAQRKVFGYITRRFLASCSIDARGAETQVQVRAGTAELFGACGLIVEVQGYLEVMQPYERWSDLDMPRELLNEGAILAIEQLTLRESQTSPPPLLSEADLIALMDRHGIGTDATIAEHIKKVQDRKYVRKLQDSRFEPTQLGISLVEGLERCQIHLARPGMRSEQEVSFKKIHTGELNAADVKAEALSQFSNTFNRLRLNCRTLDEALSHRFAGVSAAHWELVRTEFSRCGNCDILMDLKSVGSGARMERAVVCGQCGTFKLPRNGDLSCLGVNCPICSFQVVSIRNTQTSRSHPVCPACYNTPPTQANINPEAKEIEFRCFNCTHHECSLASGTPTNRSKVAACPLCRAECSIIRSTRGDRPCFRAACSRERAECGWVYFFPAETEDVTIIEGVQQTCPICRSKALSITWRRSSIPPGGSPQFSGCIWCGRTYRDALVAIGNENDFPRLPHPGAPYARDIEDIGRSAGRSNRARGSRLSVRGSSRPSIGTGRTSNSAGRWRGTSGLSRRGRGSDRRPASHS